MSDRVILESAAEDYARRCRGIGLERCDVAVLQQAMRCPAFRAEHLALLDRLAAEYRSGIPFFERPSSINLKGAAFPSKEAAIKAAEAGGCGFSPSALQVVANPEFTLLTQEVDIDLCETTARELTLKDEVMFADVYDALDYPVYLGFCDAPDETALRLASNRLGLQMNERYYVMSKPRADAKGRQHILFLDTRFRGSRVGAADASPSVALAGSSRLLICRKRK